MRQIAVIDYGSGNLHSVLHAVKAAAEKQDEVRLVTTGAELRDADAVILPGVGHFADCRQNLSKAPEMVDALTDCVIHKSRPFLGICVGMQMLADTGYEGEAVAGLGWISGTVGKLSDNDKSLKIPHMGWNSLSYQHHHPVCSGLSDNPHVYFVHSYHFTASHADTVIASTDYGQKVTAIIAKDNIIGTQFHPEKSQSEGLAFLSGFLKWRP